MPCWGRWGIGWCQQKAVYIPARGRETNRDALRAPERAKTRRVRRRPDGQVREKNSSDLALRAVRLSRPIAAELPGRRRRFCEEPRREESRRRRQKRGSASIVVTGATPIVYEGQSPTFTRQAVRREREMPGAGLEPARNFRSRGF